MMPSASLLPRLAAIRAICSVALAMLLTPPALALAQGSGRRAERRAQQECTVARVVDGDTLECEDGVRVRLLMIDTPELSQRPFGTRARDALRALTPVGTSLRLEFDVRRTDRYNRLLAFIWTEDGVLVNEEMARRGMAEVLVIQPNVKYVERIRAARDEARRARIGLWATSAFDCSPRDYRDGKC